MSGKRLYFIFLHTRKEQVFLQIDSNIRYHHNAWGNSGLLSLFSLVDMSVTQKLTEV